MGIFSVIVFTIGFYFVEKVIRCENDGLTRDAAIRIAEKKLSADFKNPSFSLKSEKFQEYGKIWLFIYSNDNCIVAVSIDKCGVSDIGGISKECTAFQK